MRARIVPVRRFGRVNVWVPGWAEIIPDRAPIEYVLIVANDDWHTAIARGDRAEIERIYTSMHPRVIGLRIEAVTP